MAAHKALALLREVIRMKKTAHTVIREGNVYTIAAVNNNGVGVCGIAGGDAAKGVPGVQLMSCQIFIILILSKQIIVLWQHRTIRKNSRR